jgi:hypothetical protein
VTLLFHATTRREARATAVEIDGSDLSTDCLATIANESPTVLIHGICEEIVSRPAGGQQITVTPNPSRDAVTLRFTLVDDGQATIDILDASGRTVTRILDASMPRGEHQLAFVPEGIPAGRYLVVLSTRALRSVHPLLLLR